MERCPVCEAPLMLSTPGCHTTGYCRVHKTVLVRYPRTGPCAHAEILDDAPLRTRLYELAKAS